MGDAKDEKREEPVNEPQEVDDGRFRCDFCGQAVARVRRVVLDRGYERLQTPHQVQYACELCSEDKEKRRLGLRHA